MGLMLKSAFSVRVVVLGAAWFIYNGVSEEKKYRVLDV